MEKEKKYQEVKKKKSQSHNLKITTDNLLAYIPLVFFSAVYVISSPFPPPPGRLISCKQSFVPAYHCIMSTYY